MLSKTLLEIANKMLLLARRVVFTILVLSVNVSRQSRNLI